MKLIKSSGKAFGLLFGAEVHILAPCTSSYGVFKDGNPLARYFCICNSHGCADLCVDSELHEIVHTAKEVGATRAVFNTDKGYYEEWRRIYRYGQFNRRREWNQSGPIIVHGLPVTCISEYTKWLWGDGLRLDEHHSIVF